MTREKGTKSWHAREREPGTGLRRPTCRRHERTPFGVCLEQEAPARGMSIATLAEKAGLNLTNVMRAMTVGHRPERRTVELLVGVLGPGSRLMQAWEETPKVGGVRRA